MHGGSEWVQRARRMHCRVCPDCGIWQHGQLPVQGQVWVLELEEEWWEVEEEELW